MFAGLPKLRQRRLPNLREVFFHKAHTLDDDTRAACEKAGLKVKFLD